jgi:hypothetical protein
LICALALAASCVCPAPVPDADGDGVSDEVELTLGSDPKHADPFTTLLTRKLPANHANPSRFVIGAAVANAGGNRFVWRVSFPQDYPRDNSNIILYLDADNDPKTGRQPDHGCEFMLRVTNGQPGNTGWTPAGGTAAAPFPRCASVGSVLYVSYDVDPKQQEGKSAFRLMILSETWEPHKGVDSVSYFAAAGPPVSDRPKIRMDSDIAKSEGVEQTFGLDRIDRAMKDPANVVLPIFGCRYEGFKFVPSEYRADNVVRESGAAKIVATVPKDGAFHPGFIFYDGGGREIIGVYVNGERKGVAVANWDDNNQHLFFLSAPVSLKQGDQLELRALGNEGGYRTEDLVLLAQKPEPRAAVYEYRHLAEQENRLTWTTTWPAACTVELAGGRKVEEPEALNNHRLELPDMKPGDEVRYRITARTRESKPVQTEWRDYTWQPFREPPTTKSGTVPLQVEVLGELTLDRWPVTSGVPFPKGVLGSARNLKLTAGDGKDVPLQVSATGHWPDGSVKWLLLDFRHSGGTADYVLHYGPGVRREDGPSSILFGGAGTLALRDAKGQEYRATLGPDGAASEETGRLRSCFRLSGQLAADRGARMLAYDARVHVYPGTPWQRVVLTFGNDVSANEFTTTQSLAWQFPVVGKEAQLVRERTAFVRQHTDDKYESSAGEGTRWSGPVGPVWVRDFWQNYPKDLEVGPDGATLWLLPPLKRDEYDWAKGTVDEHRLFFWFDPLPDAGGYKLRQGMTKTHEVWIGLDGSTPQLDRPLFAKCTPQWYADSGAFGPLTVAAADRPVVKDYDAKVAATLDSYLKNRETNREYGMLNFGDWWGERVINWGNIEYDTQHAFFLQFIRSGDLRFLGRGSEAEVHNRDVDTVHHHSDPRRVGRAYAHCLGHVGDYLAKSPLEGPNRGSPRGGFSVSHTWTEGHLDHYFLTDDRRSLETGLKIADNYDRWGTVNYDFSNCREPGWHLILSMAAYRATGDPFHLNACRIIVERVLERQTPEAALGTAGGGWRRRMVPGHCLCEPAHYGNAGFMVGVLLTGLKWYHLETGDPRVAESLHLGARFLIDDMWEDDVKGFRYTSCPKSSKGAWSNFLLFDGMAYAYQLTGDKEIAKILAAGTDSAIASMSGMGKSFSQYIRVAPHFLGTLADLK